MVDSLEILLKSFANFQNIRWIWIAPKTCHANSNNTVYTAEVVVFSQHVSCLGVASSKSLSPLDRAVISVCFAIDDLIPGMKFAFLTSRVPYCWCVAIYIEAIRRQEKKVRMNGGQSCRNSTDFTLIDLSDSSPACISMANAGLGFRSCLIVCACVWLDDGDVMVWLFAPSLFGILTDRSAGEWLVCDIKWLPHSMLNWLFSRISCCW